MISGQPTALKRYNRSLIQRLILEKGPISRPEIAAMTGLSLPTVNRTVEALRNDGLVLASEDNTGNVGRRPLLYQINNSAGFTIVLYYREGKWLSAVCDLNGEAVYQQSFDFSDGPLDKTLDDIAIIVSTLERSVPGGKAAIGVGMGIPGAVRSDGTVFSIPKIPSWEGEIIFQKLEERLGLPVYLENDVKVMTAGFYAKRCEHEMKHLLFLHIGSGLGSGLIINRKLYKGGNCFAGEFGYMIVDGKKQTERKSSLEETISSLNQLKQAGNEEAKLELVDLIAKVIVNYITVVDPELIVISGEVVDHDMLSLIIKTSHSYLPNQVPDIIRSNEENIAIFGAHRLCVTNVHRNLDLVIQRGI